MSELPPGIFDSLSELLSLYVPAECAKAPFFFPLPHIFEYSLWLAPCNFPPRDGAGHYFELGSQSFVVLQTAYKHSADRTAIGNFRLLDRSDFSVLFSIPRLVFDMTKKQNGLVR